MAELMLEHIYKEFDKNVTAVSDFHLHIKTRNSSYSSVPRDAESRRRFG